MRKFAPEYLCSSDEVYIIAEIGRNHNGDMSLARKMIDIAVDCGVNAVKFQSFTAQGFLVKKYFSPDGSFKGTDEVAINRDQHFELKDYTVSKGIDFLSTPEDLDMVDLLEKLEVKAYKTASMDLTYHDLIEKIGALNKPIILATGMSTLEEIVQGVECATQFHDKVIILHCTSMYPTPTGNVNLLTIPYLKDIFKLPVGFSDHTIGIESALGAVTLGAVVVEKHFTLDKTLPGPDHQASADPEELGAIVKGIRILEKNLGEKGKYFQSGENILRNRMRRSIVAAKDISEGEIIDQNKIVMKSAFNHGIPNNMKKFILNKKAKISIKEDELITFDKVDFS